MIVFSSQYIKVRIAHVINVMQKSYGCYNLIIRRAIVINSVFTSDCCERVANN